MAPTLSKNLMWDKSNACQLHLPINYVIEILQKNIYVHESGIVKLQIFDFTQRNVDTNSNCSQLLFITQPIFYISSYSKSFTDSDE